MWFFKSMYLNPLHFQLSSLGAFYELDISFSQEHLNSQLKPFENDWKTYNPRKPNYNRYGLSLFSLDGSLSGVPDLDSIYEYDRENGTEHTEMSFNQPTPAWKEIPEISRRLAELEPFLVRSHFIRLDTGGFFPPHRDVGEAFRLIAFFGPSPNSFHLVIDGQMRYFRPNVLYFLDTHKVHSVVSFEDDAKILVLNVKYDEAALLFVQNHRADI